MSDLITTDYTTDPPTVTERDFTPEELAQRDKDAADFAAAEQARQDAQAARESARRKIAEASGLTDAEMTALGL